MSGIMLVMVKSITEFIASKSIKKKKVALASSRNRKIMAKAVSYLAYPSCMLKLLFGFSLYLKTCICISLCDGKDTYVFGGFRNKCSSLLSI